MTKVNLTACTSSDLEKKKPAKFNKDLTKTVGVVFIKYCDKQTDGCTGENNMSPDLKG